MEEGSEQSRLTVAEDGKSLSINKIEQNVLDPLLTFFLIKYFTNPIDMVYKLGIFNFMK